MLARGLAFTALLPSVLAKVQFLGVAIAGGDFGCQINGTCPTDTTQIPLTSLGGGDGQGQMQHFVQDDGLNMFRLPISWQWLVNNQVGATLDANNLGDYDQLVQACLATGAYCIIDIHNFARFNGGIIGQGGPSNDQFVSLWTQLATKYSSDDKIVFGLMNEPHDLDIPTWAASCQQVVTAIRNANASTQMILLPGTNFDSAATLVSSGSVGPLMAITNPDGSTTNLLLDIHKYLDIDNSGTHEQCVTNNTDAFATVANFLRSVGRQGLISETGASSDPTCLTDFCQQNTFINANSDVFLGYVAWAAGSFSTSYIDSLTPTEQGGKFVDNQLMSQCVIAPFNDAPATISIPPVTPVNTAPLPTPTLNGTTNGTTNGTNPSAGSSPGPSPQPSTVSTNTTTNATAAGNSGVITIGLPGSPTNLPGFTQTATPIGGKGSGTRTAVAWSGIIGSLAFALLL